MKKEIDLDDIYVPSEDVVAREVQGEFIIIPITAQSANEEDAIFSVNESGKAIWDKLSAKKNLKNIIKELSLEFDSPASKIKNDVLGFLGELIKRKMVNVL
ncbi:MAG TPA: PqqD family protein [Candidatus Omnitrophota bacterium]|nr:PqqD family protein [Candidatus Omnitrophota bacterium]HPT39192.1 PqqD family protein [Candidatus Omnitrophota bacterium]